MNEPGQALRCGPRDGHSPPAQGALYPDLAPGASGLTKPSTALVDQVRSINKQRIRRRYGQVSAAELEAIDRGLCLYLGLAL
jgi:mRNA interferase MazF